MGTVDLAVQYATNYGFKVFPCKLDKTPYTPHGFKDATKDPTKIKELFSRYSDPQIGIATGRESGVWVLDVDTKRGKVGRESLEELERVNGKLPDTKQAITWSGGMHYFFKYTIPVQSTSGVFQDIDVRGDGGYVIAAGSRYSGKDGEGKYEWELSSPEMFAEAPSWLYLGLMPDRRNITLPILEGGRDDGIFKLACKFFGQGLSYEAVTVKIHDINTNQTIPPLPKKVVDEKIKSASKYKKPEREKIYFGESDYEKTHKIAEILSLRSESLYRYVSGDIIRINRHTNKLEVVGVPIATTEISKHVKLFKKNKTGDELEVPAGQGLVSQVVASEELMLRELHVVTSTPRFSSNGELRLDGGYNYIDKSYYMKTIDIPVVEFDEAKALLKEMLCDFAFSDRESGKDETHAYSLLFAPPMINLIERFPLHAVSAKQERTGKSLLVESIISLYGVPTPTVWPSDESEMSKKVTSILRSGPIFMFFDNIKQRIENSSVEACLTSNVFSDRILGRSEQISMPCKAPWVITGNNLSFGAEMMKRTVVCELNAHLEKPEERTGFKHPDLSIWIQENKGRLLGSVYSCICKWIKEGMPQYKGLLGGFQSYASNMGGLLDFLGFSGFLKAPFESSVDTETQKVLNFLEIWHQMAKNEPHLYTDCNSTSLVRVAEKVDGFWFANARDEHGRASAVGRFLSKYSDRVYGHFKVGKRMLDGVNLYSINVSSNTSSVPF